MYIYRFFAAAVLLALPIFAASTETWKQSSRAQFEKGTRKGLALSHDGKLSLSPALRELKDASLPYLWSIVEDPQGNIYYAGAGAANGKVGISVLAPNGQARTFAEVDGFEVHALALSANGQLYAATSPDGKVYRIDSTGKASEFYDPQAKYIWSLAIDSQGNVYVGTGDQGRIYRVSPAGQGTLFFETEENHARSLALDKQGNLIVGTEPGGLILRVSQSGQGFILHQAERQEISALAIGNDNTIYAAAIGGPVGSKSTLQISAPPPASSAPADPAKPPAVTPRPSLAPIPVLSSNTGGSELWRIAPNGQPTQLWEEPRELIYSIALDAQQRPILGTGNAGSIYRIDSPIAWTQLASAQASQITSLIAARNGRMLAVTASSGRVLEMGSALEREGTFESEVFDAEAFATWGRLQLEAASNGGSVAVSARSGNINRAQKLWSPWADLQLAENGGRIQAPASRFLQYKLTLRANAASPEVSAVNVAYRSDNLAPTVRIVEVTPPNYRFPNPAQFNVAPRSITLPPIGQTRNTPSTSLSSQDGSPTLTYFKGIRAVRWSASDPNGDALLYKVEIRGEQENDWKLLKDEVRERYLTFDASAFADGRYRIRITAKDQPSNPVGQGLEASLVSEPFLIDNTAPAVINVAQSNNGTKLVVSWRATDRFSNIASVEYALNGSDWITVDPTSKVLDSRDHEFRLELDRKPGELTVAIRVTDEFDNQTVEKLVIR